eukprot:TRINITY_DN1026_c0_g1_i3.p1 TRINITY_DN1026_c0_g1~~TRINITY_DN1026_c0_g1_i3.p1  ORF type:complete len:282 (+),score=23.32 TRINITY_DN1026_c0_g1_i3:475-1320(+)
MTDTRLKLQASHHHSSTKEITYISKNSETGVMDVMQLFSAVVFLQKGVVSAVFWDNGCYDCGYSDCFVETTNGEAEENCRAQCREGDATCSNLKIFISFLGSDKNNVKMTSANMRFSQFRSFSVGSMMGSAKGSFQLTSERIDAELQRRVKENMVYFGYETNSTTVNKPAQNITFIDVLSNNTNTSNATAASNTTSVSNITSNNNTNATSVTTNATGSTNKTTGGNATLLRVLRMSIYDMMEYVVNIFQQLCQEAKPIISSQSVHLLYIVEMCLHVQYSLS